MCIFENWRDAQLILKEQAQKIKYYLGDRDVYIRGDEIYIVASTDSFVEDYHIRSIITLLKNLGVNAQYTILPPNKKPPIGAKKI